MFAHPVSFLNQDNLQFSFGGRNKPVFTLFDAGEHQEL